MARSYVFTVEKRQTFTVFVEAESETQAHEQFEEILQAPDFEMAYEADSTDWDSELTEVQPEQPSDLH